MRRARQIAAALAVLASAGIAPGCSTKVVGQVVLVLQTDLSLPKDVDTIRIEVLNEGVPKFKNDYDRLGSKDGQIHLPGTLALDAPENPTDAITVIVSARTGGKDGSVRVVREVVTTVPPTRSAQLDIPIQFLCDGSGKLKDGNAVSTCPEGQTCIAGSCKSSTVDSSTLPDFKDEVALGDGSCLDVANCFNSNTIEVVEPASCTIPAKGGVNIALQTEGDGICGKVGCFIALDAESEAGFVTGKDGTITLPASVCTKLAEGTIVNIVSAPVTNDCRRKTSALPTCGPWSSASNNPPPDLGPIALAGGQSRPVSLVVGIDGIYWTNGGEGDGSIKSIPLLGGTPTLVAGMQAGRDVVSKDAIIVWTTAPPGVKQGAVLQSTGGVMKTLVPGLDAPEGVAIFGNKLFFTEFKTGGILTTPITGSAAPTKIAQGNYPFRIVADGTHVYWTNEGTAGQTPSNGSVARYDYAAGGAVGVETIGAAQETPRAIAIDRDVNGKATALYWANFAELGSIVRVDLKGATPGAPVTLAEGVAYPNGLTVDGTQLYWTNRGDGTVMSLAKDAKAGEKPLSIATLQNAPGTIVADATAIYWVNEGASDSPNGAVIKLPKAP